MQSEGLSAIIGDVVRRHRKDRGWSQQKLADEAHVATSTIRNTERGRSRGAYHLGKIADALGVKLGDLIREAEEQTRSMFPDVGSFLADVMARRGLSLEQLASRMAVERSDVRRLLDGNAGPIMWGAAAVALDIDPRTIEAIAEGNVTDTARIDGDVRGWLSSR